MGARRGVSNDRGQGAGWTGANRPKAEAQSEQKERERVVFSKISSGGPSKPTTVLRVDGRLILVVSITPAGNGTGCIFLQAVVASGNLTAK